MNPSSDFDVVRPKLDHLLSATGMSLKIAWKLTVSVLALAIVLGMLAGPTVQPESPSQKASHPVRVEGKEDCFRVITQLPTGRDTLKIELVDRPNKLQTHLIYDKNGINHFFTVNHKLINMGYFRKREDEEVVNIRTPGAYYTIGLHDTGDSYVIVNAATKDRPSLGKIGVSPQGERRPTSDDIHAQR